MSEFYDIGIIGGGIHGCGLAQAAAAAGYRTVVLERTALAHGTSSKSSKLIHGGLRYLESGQWGLVRQSLFERELLIRNAPHLVHYVPFYIPIYSETSRQAWKIRTGLSLYALLGNLSPHSKFHRVPKPEWSNLDAISTQGLTSVYQYWDAQTDDAKLTRAVMQSAQKLGATLLCPAAVERVDYQSGEYHIAYSHGRHSGIAHCVILINAAGPWVDKIHSLIRPASEFPPLELVQGTHIILQQPAPRGVYYVESPQDRRAIFVMPWYGKTLIGTTEKRFQGDPDNVMAEHTESEYLINIARHYFPNIDATIVDQFAGLRALPTGTQSVFNRPRDTVVHTVPTLPGYLALIGGKLTGYRATAEKVIRLIKPNLRIRMPIADTKELRLEPVEQDKPVT